MNVTIQYHLNVKSTPKMSLPQLPLPSPPPTASPQFPHTFGHAKMSNWQQQQMWISKMANYHHRVRRWNDKPKLPVWVGLCPRRHHRQWQRGMWHHTMAMLVMLLRQFLVNCITVIPARKKRNCQWIEQPQPQQQQQHHISIKPKSGAKDPGGDIQQAVSVRATAVASAAAAAHRNQWYGIYSILAKYTTTCIVDHSQQPPHSHNCVNIS